MISVETINPVFSNAEGKTPEERQKNRAKAWEKTKKVYSKAKETGLLQGLENLALQKGAEVSGGTELPPPPPAPTPEPMSKALKYGLIIGGVAVVGFAVYWFAIRKK